MQGKYERIGLPVWESCAMSFQTILAVVVIGILLVVAFLSIWWLSREDR